MNEIYLISCFKNKLKKREYLEGEVFSLPFSGVFHGQVIKIVDVISHENILIPEGGAVCLCRLAIISVVKNKIVGKLESIEFL